MTGKTKGTLYVLLCVALWALIPVVAKMGQTTLDNHQFLFWSSLVSLLSLLMASKVYGTLHEIITYSLKDWIYLLGLGLLGTYVYYLFLYLGYAKAVGMEVLVVQYTWPILILLLSIFILKEKLSTQKVVSVLFGFMGVLIVLSKGNFSDIQISNGPVILLVGAGAFCFALFSVLSKIVKNKDPLVVTSIYFLAATIASFSSMNYFSGFLLPSKSEIIPILLNGILVNGFSYLFWFIALKSTQASYLAPFIFITPVLSAVYLWIFFNEPVVLMYVLGLFFVILSGLINSLSKNKQFF